MRGSAPSSPTSAGFIPSPRLSTMIMPPIAAASSVVDERAHPVGELAREGDAVDRGRLVLGGESGLRRRRRCARATRRPPAAQSARMRDADAHGACSYTRTQSTSIVCGKTVLRIGRAHEVAADRDVQDQVERVVEDPLRRSRHRGVDRVVERRRPRTSRSGRRVHSTVKTWKSSSKRACCSS